LSSIVGAVAADLAAVLVLAWWNSYLK
jgi:hypothetical protein